MHPILMYFSFWRPLSLLVVLIFFSQSPSRHVFITFHFWYSSFSFRAFFTFCAGTASRSGRRKSTADHRHNVMTLAYVVPPFVANAAYTPSFYLASSPQLTRCYRYNNNGKPIGRTNSVTTLCWRYLSYCNNTRHLSFNGDCKSSRRMTWPTCMSLPGRRAPHNLE